TASYVSQNMGLIGLSCETAESVNDKGIMRDIWNNAGLAVPEYKIVSSLDELKEAINKIGFPCILKPTDCGGAGRGISIIRSYEDVVWSFNFARPYVKNDRFIIEEFLDGTEMTIESISIGGKVYILAMSDKVKPDVKTRVATSLNFPAVLPEVILQKVKKLVQKAVTTIGIDNGMAHTEVIVTKDRPKLVEIGGRGGGGHVFHTCIETTSGIKAPVECAKLLTGMEVNLSEVKKKGCVYRFFTPPKGILKSVKNVEKAKSVKGVLDLDIVKKIGEKVGDLENSLHRTGFVVTKGEDRSEAISLADYIESMIQFEVIAINEENTRDYKK
ncbi:MAG: ATP-grasp domain-containing protein, partial [Thermodesulfobacteriota bacterium]|nr:ATP-grasp domain-containing protein [Thermodesulfobacteriota bacterium]